MKSNSLEPSAALCMLNVNSIICSQEKRKLRQKRHLWNLNEFHRQKSSLGSKTENDYRAVSEEPVRISEGSAFDQQILLHLECLLLTSILILANVKYLDKYSLIMCMFFYLGILCTHPSQAFENCSFSPELGKEHLWVGHLGKALYKSFDLNNELMKYSLIHTLFNEHVGAMQETALHV